MINADPSLERLLKRFTSENDGHIEYREKNLLTALRFEYKLSFDDDQIQFLFYQKLKALKLGGITKNSYTKVFLNSNDTFSLFVKSPNIFSSLLGLESIKVESNNPELEEFFKGEEFRMYFKRLSGYTIRPSNTVNSMLFQFEKGNYLMFEKKKTITDDQTVQSLLFSFRKLKLLLD